MSECSSASRWREFNAPVLAVCGHSGSGKTTLLEAAIPHLVARGLSVAVVKHDAHGFTVDREGKDSDRFFKAGATVALRGPGEQFQRRGKHSSLTLEATLADVARDHDVILVEGHKDTDLPKLWLNKSEESLPPAEVTDVLEILPWRSERLKMFLCFIDSWVLRAWKARPLFAGVLVGGQSSRMGSPKQMLEFQGRPLGQIVATALMSVLPRTSSKTSESLGILNPNLALLGSGPVPSMLRNITRLVDPPDLAGPIAGLLAAHRWNPRAAWIVAACDHPWLSKSDVQFLVDQRRPGAWAVIPVQPDGNPCPTFALFEPQALEALERKLVSHGPERVRIAELFEHPHSVLIPHFTRGLFNTNTPLEFERASQLTEEDLRVSGSRSSARRVKPALSPLG